MRKNAEIDINFINLNIFVMMEVVFDIYSIFEFILITIHLIILITSFVYKSKFMSITVIRIK